jgi:hypothetical protein
MDEEEEDAYGDAKVEEDGRCVVVDGVTWGMSVRERL